MTVLIVFFALTCQVHAANPADLTNLHRWSGPFYKVANDDNDWFLSLTQPICGVAITYINWHSEEGHIQNQFIFTKSVNDSLDIAFDTDSWDNCDYKGKKDLTFDLHNNDDGIGLMIPLEKNDQVALGLRKKLKGLEFYSTFKNGGKPILGLSCTDSNNITYHAAICNKNKWFRCTKTINNWSPELRVKWSDKDSALGFGIAYSY